MARVRATGMQPVVRRDAMMGAMSEPMTMDRMSRKEFDVPQPVMIAMGSTGEPPMEPGQPTGQAPANPQYVEGNPMGTAIRTKLQEWMGNPVMPSQEKSQIELLEEEERRK